MSITFDSGTGVSATGAIGCSSATGSSTTGASATVTGEKSASGSTGVYSTFCSFFILSNAAFISYVIS